MFTGIVEAVGEVTAVTNSPDGTRLTIAVPVAGSLDPGQSVSIDGACLTVESQDAETFEAFLASETLARTTLGELTAGDQVNVERALPADGRFDGHIVQGHVDATTEVTAIESVGEDWAYEFALPEDLAAYVTEKGSIAVDGVSLTVADRDDATFSVAIVPTTYDETTFSRLAVGDRVNLEIDVLAKYVEQLVE